MYERWRCIRKGCAKFIPKNKSNSSTHKRVVILPTAIVNTAALSDILNTNIMFTEISVVKNVNIQMCFRWS